ncbi:MAG: stage II sporulation protein M [Clostridiaceae bacterium]|nr:stage II sporulation protein M [Clostridiaceae bacterium]
MKKLFSASVSFFQKLTIALFLIGFVLGGMLGNILESALYAPVLSLFQNTVKKLPSLDINRNDVFLFCFQENLKCYLLLVFFSMTNAWRCYYFIFLLYSGLCYGLLFTFCTLLNGLGGIPQFLCFLLPQAILSIPLFLILLKKLEAFHTSWFLPENNTGSGFLHQKKRVLLIRQFPLFLVFILLLLVSSLLEGYLNLPLIQYFNFGL